MWQSQVPLRGSNVLSWTARMLGCEMLAVFPIGFLVSTACAWMHHVGTKAFCMQTTIVACVHDACIHCRDDVFDFHILLTLVWVEVCSKWHAWHEHSCLMNIGIHLMHACNRMCSSDLPCAIMQVPFHRMLRWQALGAGLAMLHVPAVCNRVAAAVSCESCGNMQYLICALVALEGFLVPALFCYMVEKLARLLYISQLRDRAIQAMSPSNSS